MTYKRFSYSTTQSVFTIVFKKKKKKRRKQKNKNKQNRKEIFTERKRTNY